MRLLLNAFEIKHARTFRINLFISVYVCIENRPKQAYM